MRCQKCGFENAEDAAFCVECGNELKKRCSGCGRELPDGVKYCPGCGMRCDGKRFCPTCGAIVDANAKHCGACGAKLQEMSGQMNDAAVRTFRTKKSRKFDRKHILDIVRGGLVTALAIVVFILSFFSAFKIGDLSELISDMGVDAKADMTIRVSTTDIIGGAFACIAPKTQNERLKDLEKYAKKHLSIRDYSQLQSSGDGSMEIAARILEKYNILKFVSTRENMKAHPEWPLQIGFMAVGAFAVIGCTAAFLIVSVISLVYLITGRRKAVKAVNTLAVVSAFVAAGCGLLCAITFDGAIGGGMLTVLICGLLASCIGFIYSLVVREFRINRQSLAAVLSGGITVALCLVLCFLSLGALVSVKCSFLIEESEMIFRYGYNSSDLSLAWAVLRNAVAGGEQAIQFGGAFDYFKGIATVVGSLPDSIIGALVSPALMGALGSLSGGEVALTALGIVMLILNFIMVGLLISAMIMTVNDFVNGRSKCRFALAIAIFVIALAALGMSVGYAIIVNRTMAPFEEIDYTAKVSPAVIAAVVFGCCNLVQSVVFRILSRPHKQPAQAVEQ